MLNKIISCICGLFLLVMSCIVYLCLFQMDTVYACKRYFEFNNIMYLFFGTMIIILLCLLLNVTIKDFSVDKFIKISSVVYFVILLITTYHYYFYTDWDVGYQIIPNSFAIAIGDYNRIDNYYLSMYPNNIFIIFLFSILIKIAAMLHISNWYMLLIAFQCLIYAIAAVLVYKTSKKLLDNETYALLTYILYMALIGVSPWVVVPYSDSIGLLFPISILFLYLKIKETRGEKQQLLLLGILVGVMFFGYKIKPQIGIVTISILIIECLNFLNSFIKLNKNTAQLKRWSSVLKKRLCVIVGVLLISVLSMNVITQVCHIYVDDERSFGAEHFLMMGMNSERQGIYSQEDVNFSASFPTKEERKSATLIEIKDRINEHGAIGLVNLAKSKLLTTYNDGSYAWTHEGSFFIKTFDHGNSKIRDFFENLYYRDGQYQNYFYNFVQSVWLAVLFFSIFCAFSKRDDEVGILMLTVIGLTLFEILFEARARYLFTNIPIYILLAVIGLKTLVDKVVELKVRVDKNEQ